MLFFYVRHGDPIYDPDSLTPLGERQAEAVAKRLALYGIDKVYSSTSTRAIETARPTCELTKKECEQLDFCNEMHAWKDLSYVEDGVKRWLYEQPYGKAIFSDPSVIALGYDWYDHPDLMKYKNGYERIRLEADKFLLSLGYEHVSRTGKYKVVTPNNERVALFAHQGFGIAFLSAILDIPYPLFSMHFDLCHSGMTVIDFKEENGYAYPKVLTLSSDSHIYREGLPTKYNGKIYF